MIVVADPFRVDDGQFAIDLPGGRVLFTTRAAGDLAARHGRSDSLLRAVGPPPERWAQDHQVHGARVRVVGANGFVRPFTSEADGQATARRDVACIVRAADCVPIALVAPEAVAMLHGGWRGLAAGVIEEGVNVLTTLGASEIRAAIGPHARVCCYEAGENVHAAFADLGPEVRRGDNADLEAVSRLKLGRCGIKQVHALGACTICSDVATFWSFRRDGERAGRQGGFVWRS